MTKPITTADSNGKPIKRRRSPKGEMRREEILEAAMRHFAHDGYQSASFAAIAQDVGLTLPGLLHYFPTKVNLLLAILNRRDIESMPTLTREGEGWRSFLHGLVAVAQRNQTIPGVVRTFAVLNAESLTKDHPAEAWFSERIIWARDTVADILQAGIDAGELKADINCNNIVAELIAMMDGLQMLWLRNPADFDMVSIFADYIERLIASIEAKPV